MHVCFLLPYDMIARNYVSTGVVSELLAQDEIKTVTIISRTKPSFEHAKLGWKKLISPFGYKTEKPFTIRRFLSDVKFTLGYYIHLSLVNRFNSIKRFTGFENRIKQSSRLHFISAKEGLPTSKWWGFPFRRCSHLFEWLKTLYKTNFLLNYHDVEAIFNENAFDLIIVGHLQNHFIAPYINSCEKRNIPHIAINGSWDQPTTKGPILFEFEEFLVQNKQVAEDLNHFHGIQPSQIKVVGWPQMDLYAQQHALIERKKFLNMINVPKVAQYILVGAYSERLGYHEPKMCEELAQYLLKHEAFKHVIIYIRSHPLDHDWQKRMKHLLDYPNIMIEPPSSGNLEHLVNLLKHAACVISSAGTISLDAVALDTPAIAVAFEDEQLPFYDRPSRRYDMEHYAEVMKTNGVKKVASQEALNDAVVKYLENNHASAAERKALRDSHLEPLDGKAAARITTEIIKKAQA